VWNSPTLVFPSNINKLSDSKVLPVKLLAMLEPSVGATLQSGGTIVDDVFGHYPQLGWARLVKEFLRSA